MAENENEEYEFAELDTMNPEPDSEEPGEFSTEKPEFAERRKAPNVRRNILVVLGLFLLLVLGWKFVGSFFSAKPAVQEPVAPTLPVSQPVTQSQTPPPALPLPASPPPVAVQQPSADDTALIREVKQKLSALEIGQANVRQEMTTVTGQIENVTANMETLAANVANLQKMIASLAATVEDQSRQIVILTDRTAPKVVRAPPPKRTPRPVYYIQAIIPGRAWLIATNGHTMTVREGSVIPEYGTVRLIDPQQGRVVLSSGQAIRFSQQDS